MVDGWWEKRRDAMDLCGFEKYCSCIRGFIPANSSVERQLDDEGTDCISELIH